MIVALLSFVFGLIELILGLRFLFLLFGANPFVPFVAWIYNVGYSFASPFIGILGQPGTEIVPVGAVHSVFDLSTLIALVVYAAVGGLLIGLFTRRPWQVNVIN